MPLVTVSFNQCQASARVMPKALRQSDQAEEKTRTSQYSFIRFQFLSPAWGWRQSAKLFRLQLAGLPTNVKYRIQINNLPPANSTNYPGGVIPMAVQTNGALSLATPKSH
jgi:hypothetical protein